MLPSARKANSYLQPGESHQRVELLFYCPEPGALTLETQLLFDLVPNHIHFARIFEDGKPAAEYFFSVDNRRQVIKQYGQETQEVAVHATAGYLFTQYLLLGIEHLGNGLDHLAFLLAVILLVGRVREVLIAITGFTIGHSITLALTVLDILRPTAEAIEALIGFTIAIVAFESVGQRTGATKGLAKLAGCVLIIAAFLAWRGGSGVLSVVSLAGLALFTVSYLLVTQLFFCNLTESDLKQDSPVG